MSENARLLDVEKKVAAQEVMVAKFDTALEKISEVSLNVSKLLAVHEQRLEAQEDFTKSIPELLEDRRKEYYQRFEEIHGRISDTDQELRKEMSNNHKEILGEIKSLQTDIKDLGEDMSEKHNTLRTGLEADFTEKVEAVSQRVSKLEKLAYIVIGGATVVGFLLSQALGILQIFH